MKHIARRKRRIVLFILLSLAILALAACQAAILNPPRLATSSAPLATPAPENSEPLFLPAPTATPGQVFMADPSIDRAPSLNIWINETSPEHTQLLSSMMEDFHQQSGIDVSLQQVSPMLLPELMQTAVLSDTLPDIVLHPVEYTMAWSERGILDPQVTGAIIDELGRDTFDPAALALVDADGQPAGLPSDGYQQLWLYRRDWIEEAQLEPPDTYSNLLLAAETFVDRENFISGLVIPTESNLINTHRAFEHLAIANGCRLINEQGEVLLLEEACREALDFYYSIVNQFSPIGVQTDTSARNAFLEGRTAIIMTSPSILSDLVAADRLDQTTGILTQISGGGPDPTPANFGNIRVLGITRSADPQAASAFARYWFNEGYPDWLAVDSERKVPMRLGTTSQPRQFIDSWGQTPVAGDESLLDLFGAETVSQLRDGIATTPRWGFREGQGAVVGELYEKLTFSVVLQEMLSGYFNTEKTIQEAYNRVIDLIPNYAFLPTPTPEPTLEADS